MTQRNTRQKELIKSIIQGNDIHMSADEVVEQVKKIDATIGVATVYRNLNSLVKQGEITKLMTNEQQVIFDGNPTPHYNFICRQCGQVKDVPLAYSHKLNKEVETLLGVQVFNHQQTFEGLCPDCKREQEKQEGKITWN